MACPNEILIFLFLLFLLFFTYFGPKMTVKFGFVKKFNWFSPEPNVDSLGN